jgi:hypothetical protein
VSKPACCAHSWVVQTEWAQTENTDLSDAALGWVEGLPFGLFMSAQLRGSSDADSNSRADRVGLRRIGMLLRPTTIYPPGGTRRKFAPKPVCASAAEYSERFMLESEMQTRAMRHRVKCHGMEYLRLIPHPTFRRLGPSRSTRRKLVALSCFGSCAGDFLLLISIH